MNKTKKLLQLTIICTSALSLTAFLSGCGILDNVIDNIKRQSELPSNLEIAQELAACFNDKDTSALKEMLCERSQDLDDIDEQIQDAFDFIDGNIISFDENVTGSEGKSNRYGTTTELDRFFSIDDIVTDTKQEYSIYVSENLIYLNDPKREGITQIIIENESDDSKIEVGYSWQEFYTEGRDIASKAAKALGEGDDYAFSQLLCDDLAESPETQKNISKAMDFFEGMPYFGKVPDDNLEYDGKHDIHVTVYEEETVENGEPVCIKLKIDCENIDTDADRIFTSEIEAYIQNDENPKLIGITKFILFDEDKNSIIIE